MRSARWAILTLLPISKMKILLTMPMVAASITKRHASGIVMKKRVMSG